MNHYQCSAKVYTDQDFDHVTSETFTVQCSSPSGCRREIESMIGKRLLVVELIKGMENGDYV